MKAFFSPVGCAVVGASRDQAKPGHQMLVSMLEAGFPRAALYPVNPNEGEVAGLPAYPDLASIPGPVELAVLMVPPRALDAVLADVARRRRDRADLAAVIVTAGGYAELGTDEGRDRQARLVEVTRAAGVRLMGPNCIGVIDNVSHLDTTFLHGVVHRPGPISFVSQSGAVGSWLVQMLSSEAEPVGFSKLVSLGNMADVTMAEVLDYLAEDPSTGVVGVYLEGTSRPRELLRAMAALARVKPVVVLKTGRTVAGRCAATSHTGALAGADKIWDGALRQAGALRVDRMEEFVDILRALGATGGGAGATTATSPPTVGSPAALSLTPPPDDSALRVFLVTHAGGPGVYAMDLLAQHPSLLVPAVVNAGTRHALQAAAPPLSSVCRPEGHIDMTASATAEQHAEVTRLLMKDPAVDAVVTLDMPIRFLGEEEVARALVRAWEDGRNWTDKGPWARRAAPIFLPVLMHGKWSEKGRAILEKAGLPALGSPDRAVAALAGLARLRRLRRPEEADFDLDAGGREAGGLEAADLEADDRELGGREPGCREARGQRPGEPASRHGAEGVTLNEIESAELLRATGVAFARGTLARSKDEALLAARTLGYPVVLKLCSRAIPHKVAAGAVRLALKDEGELSRAFDDLDERARALLGGGGEPAAHDRGRAPSGGGPAAASPGSAAAPPGLVASPSPAAAIPGLDGFLVQAMAPKGLEVIVGGLRDPLFGPVVAVGPGGSRVGLDAPLLFRLAPLCPAEAAMLAKELLDSLGVPPGHGPGLHVSPGVYDPGALASVILGLSRLLVGRPDIVEADLNPVILYPEGALAVDALVRLDAPGPVA